MHENFAYNMFARLLYHQSAFIQFYYLSCTFRSRFYFSSSFAASSSSSSFSSSSSSVLCTAIEKNIHGWQEERWRGEKLLYAVKYFRGISTFDPFTAGSMSPELSHFRRKISSLCRFWESFRIRKCMFLHTHVFLRWYRIECALRYSDSENFDVHSNLK